MAADLKKNKDAIVKAWKDVSDPHSSCSWALFGYEGQTATIKVVDTGDNYDDMLESLNSGKLMYVYCRVMDPNTSLPKFVFINWQGEGVPETLKGKCTSHVKDVVAVLHGAHVTINARTESDVEYSDVLKLVAKSSGANYSIHKEKASGSSVPETGPVGSVYQKVVPQREIKLNERDQFWQKTELEEKRRVEEEKKKQAEIQLKAEQERKRREVEEETERERAAAQHAREVAQQRNAKQQETAVPSVAPESKWDHSIQDDDDKERRNRSESLRKQRAAEAASLVQQREVNPRELFKQRERAMSQEEDTLPKKLPPVPKKAARNIGIDAAGEAQPLPHLEPSPCRQPSPPLQHQSSPPPSPPPARRAAVPSPPPASQGVVSQSPLPVEKEEAVQALFPTSGSAAPAAAPVLPNLLAQGMPRRQTADSDEESDHEQDWDEPSQEHLEPGAEQPRVAQQHPQSEPQGEGGLMAKAIYDYQAAADDELSFDPGDTIYEIEQVDEGWWMGTTSDGHRGIFPANYVELI